MDFSIKQALGVAVVVIVAALILVLASNLNTKNAKQAKSNNDNMWTNVNNTVEKSTAAAQKAADDANTAFGGTVVNQGQKPANTASGGTVNHGA